AWKNLTYTPLSALLSILLFALSIGLISLLLNLREQADQQFDANLAGIDLVVGAKGSPLELTLNSMYHVGYATGNITLQQAKPYFNPRHPIVEDAIPLSVGDSYRGYRIVGTIPKILSWYDAEVAEGEVWRADFTVTIGAEVATVNSLKIGDTFKSNHGIIDEGANNIEHDDDFTVVGILAPSGTVMDQLILTTTQTYWHSHDHGDDDHAGHDHGNEDHSGHDHGEEDHAGHDHGDEDHAGHDHGDEDHAGHDHGDDDHAGHDHGDDDHAGHDHGAEDHSGHDHGEEDHTGHDHAHDEDPVEVLLKENPEKEITSILVKYKNASSFQALNFPRNINENTELLAANPAYEISEVRRQFDSGQRILGILVLAITVVSAFSIFIALFNSLRERRYELALLRVMGAGRPKLFGLILLEGLVVAIIGYFLGLLLSHGILYLMAVNIKDDFRYSLDSTHFLAEEAWLLIGALAIGFLAALFPAIQAARTDIGETLVEGQ
ncbi:MAG: FtsX-like permease family protein, partial [Bacteroidota bacterium]